MVELATIEKELANLGAAIAQTGALPAFIEQARDRERHRATLTERLAALDTAAHTGALDSAAVQQALRDRLAQWRTLLHRQVAQAQQILRKLLVGRVTFTPATDGQGKFFTFQGQGSLGRVLEGMMPPAAHSPLVQPGWSPSGIEPASR